MLAVTPDYTPKMEDAPVAMQRRNNQSCRYYRPDLGKKFGYIWDANCTFDGVGDVLGLSDMGAKMGIAGLALAGAAGLTAMTAWAFHVRGADRPKWRPALLVTAGVGLLALAWRGQYALAQARLETVASGGK